MPGPNQWGSGGAGDILTNPVNYGTWYRFQQVPGTRAIGMPELYKLITFLSIIMERGYTVALVTDSVCPGCHPGDLPGVYGKHG
jgi:hypothetical protein